jgi:hypothetical protein
MTNDQIIQGPTKVQQGHGEFLLLLPSQIPLLTECVLKVFLQNERIKNLPLQKCQSGELMTMVKFNKSTDDYLRPQSLSEGVIMTPR